MADLALRPCLDFQVFSFSVFGYVWGMDRILDLSGQRWKQRRENNLEFFLYHAPRTPFVSLDIEIMFVPAWMDDDDYESEHRALYLEIDAQMPRTGNWRDIIGRRLEFQRALVNEKGEVVERAPSAPEMEVWSLGTGVNSFYTHGKDFWHTCVTFGEPKAENPFELPISVEAFHPSKGAREARMDLLHDEVAEFLGQPMPYKPERDARLKEGWWLRYTGSVEFIKVFCNVPVNAADPVGWAKKLTQRELGLTEFGNWHVNGADDWSETFKPEDGVTENGRLVLLNPLSPFWKEALAREKKRREEKR